MWLFEGRQGVVFVVLEQPKSNPNQYPMDFPGDTHVIHLLRYPYIQAGTGLPTSFYPTSADYLYP